jgi:hypothetical protein
MHLSRMFSWFRSTRVADFTPEGLLLSHLTPAQQATWKREGWVDEGLFRIYPGGCIGVPNFSSLDCLCIRSAEPVPAIDRVMALVLLARCNPRALELTANRYTSYPRMIGGSLYY